MDLKNVSNEKLIHDLERLVRSERKITHLILLHIQEFEERKLYADLGYPKMETYLVQKFGYSGSSAQRRIQSARVLTLVPGLEQKIEDGVLNLSQLVQVQGAINFQSKAGTATDLEVVHQALAKIESQNGFKTTQILAQVFDQPVQFIEKTTPQADGSVVITMTLSEQEYADLQKCRELLSATCDSHKTSTLLTTLVRKYVKSKLGQPATASNLETASPKIPTQRSTASVPQRRYLPKGWKRSLYDRAGGQCEFVSYKTKQRCSGRHHLQIDHVQPLAMGGPDNYENLRILCQTHNLLAARRAGLFHDH